LKQGTSPVDGVGVGVVSGVDVGVGVGDVGVGVGVSGIVGVGVGVTQLLKHTGPLSSVTSPVIVPGLAPGQLIVYV
jgi:hypothetical protein